MESSPEKENLKEDGHIAKWFKNPYNIGIVLVLLVAFLIRLYYFSLTHNQPVWWDEADYLNIAKHWVNGLDYPVNVIRPILLPAIISGFYLLGLGELSIRLFILLSSLLCILLIYLIGKLFFNEKVGLISSALLAGFWSFTFFSYRILVDVPLTLLWLSSIYFFFDAYFKNKSWKFFIAPGILLGAAFLIKFTSVALVFIFAIYLLGTEKLAIFKNKKILTFYLAALLSVIPFFIWEYVKYSSPVAFFSKTTETIVTKEGFFSSFFGHLFLSAKVLDFLLEFLFFGALIWALFEFFIGVDSALLKGKDSNKLFFTHLWIFVSIGLFAYLFSANSAEERYYFIFYPAMFLLIGKLLSDVFVFVKKYSKHFAAILIVIVLCLSLYPNVVQADQIIKVKKDSFKELQQAGLWIKSHTEKNESFLVVEESAETVYYAERAYNIEEHNIRNQTDLLNRIQKHHPSYLVLSFYYYLGRNNGGSVEVLQYVFSHPELFSVVQTYGPYIDDQKTLPLVVIVKINPIFWTSSN